MFIGKNSRTLSTKDSDISLLKAHFHKSFLIFHSNHFLLDVTRLWSKHQQFYQRKKILAERKKQIIELNNL